MQLEKGEKILECSNRIVEVINELDDPGHGVCRVEQKRALLCDLPETYDVITEHILGGD